MTEAVTSARRWLSLRQGPIKFSLAVGGGVAVAGVLLGFFPYGEIHPVWGPMGDASAYWRAARAEDPYVWLPGSAEYRYSPAFLWLIAPISWLPWEWFAVVWLALHLAVLAWFRAPYLLAFPPVADDIIRGNIGLFLAAMVVFSLRFPACWAFGFLTKVTPGIGVAWDAARGSWRSVAMAGFVTAAIVGIGLLLDPGSWHDWWASLLAGTGGLNTVVPLPIRGTLGIIVIVVAARRANPSLVPIGVTLAMPTLWLSSLAVLAAWVPLRRSMRSTQIAAEAEEPG